MYIYMYIYICIYPHQLSVQHKCIHSSPPPTQPHTTLLHTQLYYTHLHTTLLHTHLHITLLHTHTHTTYYTHTSLAEGFWHGDKTDSLFVATTRACVDLAARSLSANTCVCVCVCMEK